MIHYGFTKTLNLPFEETVARVTHALQKEGFGIISKIDVKEKFKEKLGIECENYLILGACDPVKAYEAISHEQNIGLLLPCNILIYQKGDQTVLSIVRPTVAMERVHNNHLKPIAEDAEKSLKRVFDALSLEEYSTHQSNDRVRRNTSEQANLDIDYHIISEVGAYLNCNESAITARIIQLDQEWSIERWLELNASIFALIGILLGAFVHIYWLILAALVLIFLGLHAIQGWCPPVPIFRAKGVRTRKEIDWEKFALKFLRGDFNHISHKPQNIQQLFEAVKK